MVIITIMAKDNGGFKSFVSHGDTVKQNEVLGSICIFSSCEPVRSPVNGTVSKIYDHSDTGNIVHVGFNLYDISEGMNDPLQ